jgi:hypothetical protein
MRYRFRVPRSSIDRTLPRKSECEVQMQAQYGQAPRFGAPVRYRMLGEMSWRTGETVKLDGLELMFLSETPLELRAAVEVVLPAKVQGMERGMQLKLLCLGRVVQRFLANWPDLRPALVVEISSCQIVPEADDGEANAA